jgi:hypothetical protein
MLKRILSISITGALVFGLLYMVVATRSTLYTQVKAKKEALYFGLGGKETIEIIIGEFINIASGDKRISNFFPKTVNNPKRLAGLKKNLIDQICTIAHDPCKCYSKVRKSTSVDIEMIGNDINALVEKFVITLNKINAPEAKQVDLLIPLLNTEQDVPVGELREGIRPTRRYPKEELVDEDVEEMNFDNEEKLQEWLNVKAKEKRLLKNLIPVGYGISIFIFVSDGASIKSNPYSVHRLNNRLNKKVLLNFLKQNRSRVFVGIHQLEGSCLIVFRDGK